MEIQEGKCIGKTDMNLENGDRNKLVGNLHCATTNKATCFCIKKYSNVLAAMFWYTQASRPQQTPGIKAPSS
jgi:hypothetical protein